MDCSLPNRYKGDNCDRGEEMTEMGQKPISTIWKAKNRRTDFLMLLLVSGAAEATVEEEASGGMGSNKHSNSRRCTRVTISFHCATVGLPGAGMGCIGTLLSGDWLGQID